MSQSVDEFLESFFILIVSLTMLLSIIRILDGATRVSTTDILLVLIVFGIGGKMLVESGPKVSSAVVDAIRTLVSKEE